MTTIYIGIVILIILIIHRFRILIIKRIVGEIVGERVKGTLKIPKRRTINSIYIKLIGNNIVKLENRKDFSSRLYKSEMILDTCKGSIFMIRIKYFTRYPIYFFTYNRLLLIGNNKASKYLTKLIKAKDENALRFKAGYDSVSEDLFR